ncbi:MAG: response regulator [Candidatus Competibacteraceae bacterium]|nr:MAG: response regulator [Candidatus Competibacteraceae bacterium]
MNIKKALVVDDSKVAHLTLRKLLLERGIEVDWVGSGEDCIKYLETKKPDIIFMDVMMPGMDGFETTRAIAGQRQDASPIVMCSANATDEDKRDAKESGAVGFLSKPYTPDQLDTVMQTVSEGTAAISVEETVASTTAVPTPSVVEKAPAVLPELAAPPEKAAPAAEAPIRVPAGMSETASEVEQIAERVAWAAAEKVARDIIQELVPNLTREIAVQTARGVAEDLGRRAAHAAVRASQEAAKQVATEIARGTAERTARTTAQESARAVAEQAAREISEGVSQRNVAHGLEINREGLLKEIEARVDRHSKETLTLAIDSQEFKQQIIQMVRGGIQPVIETIARESSERAVRQATANLSTETGGSSGNRGTVAMVISIIALLGAATALIGSILKLF